MNTSRAWGGIILIAVGALFLLHTLDLADFGEVIRIGWPIILIVVGLRVLLGRRRYPYVPPPPGAETTPYPGIPSTATVADMIDQSTVFGSLDIHATSQSFAGGAASTVFGEVNIDLTAAQLKEGQSLLRLSGVFGAISVRLPRGTEYAVVLNTVLGTATADEQHQDGFTPSLRHQTPGYAEAPRRLMITASVVFGEIKVKSL